jgi:Domain of unknown function (DUF4328)
MQATAANATLGTTFRSGHRRAVAAIVCLSLSIVVSVATVTIVHDYFVVWLGPLTLGGSLLAGMSGLSCVVSFLIWEYQAYRNLPALGASELEESPGSAVGWWFVPILNLWKPLRTMVEIWKASDPDTLATTPEGRKRMPFPVLPALWWTFLLLSLLIANLLAVPDRIAYQGEVVTIGMLLSAVMDVTVASLAIALIREIDRLQSQKAEAIEAGKQLLTARITKAGLGEEYEAALPGRPIGEGRG